MSTRMDTIELYGTVSELHRATEYLHELLGGAARQLVAVEELAKVSRLGRTIEGLGEHAEVPDAVVAASRRLSDELGHVETYAPKKAAEAAGDLIDALEHALADARRRCEVRGDG